MEGLDVTPESPSSSFSFFRPPSAMKRRERKSSHMAWPCSCNAVSGFTFDFLMLFDLLLRGGKHLRGGEAEMFKKGLIRRRGAEAFHGGPGTSWPPIAVPA